MSARHLVLGLALLLGSGCYKINYVAAPSAPYPQSKSWHHIGIFGLVEFSEPVMLDQICPMGFARVENEISFVNGLVSSPHFPLAPPSVLGLVWPLNWLYQPHTVKVYCKSGQAFDVEVNEQGLALSAQPVEG